jgi:hypothetical protein
MCSQRSARVQGGGTLACREMLRMRCAVHPPARPPTSRPARQLARQPLSHPSAPHLPGRRPGPAQHTSAPWCPTACWGGATAPTPAGPRQGSAQGCCRSLRLRPAPSRRRCWCLQHAAAHSTCQWGEGRGVVCVGGVASICGCTQHMTCYVQICVHMLARSAAHIWGGTNKQTSTSAPIEHWHQQQLLLLLIVAALSGPSRSTAAPGPSSPMAARQLLGSPSSSAEWSSHTAISLPRCWSKM